jgi:hypothetical protein
MSRRPKGIILPKRILILCEGESEKIYLEGMRIEHSKRYSSIDIEVYQPKNYSPVGLVNEAKKKMKDAKKEYPFFSVWIVFDKDKHQNIDQTFSIAKQNLPKINIAFSNICFEYWIFLHFEKKKRAFRDSDELIKYIEKKCQFNYSKTMNIYPALKDKISQAIENCKWLHQQNKFDLSHNIKPYNLEAYTNFDQLYSFLMKIFK